MTMPLRPVGNVFYFVDDLSAAITWYTDRLGSGPVLRASQMAAFQIDHIRLTLHDVDRYNQVGPAGPVAYWDVDNVDNIVAEWTSHGATAHRGPRTIMTGERLCQLLDPFGNLFGIRQPPGFTV